MGVADDNVVVEREVGTYSCTTDVTGATISVIFAVWVPLLPVPDIVIVDVPVVAVGVALKTNEAVDEVVDGVKTPDTPDGKFDTFNATEPLNPDKSEIVTVLVTFPPR